MQLILTLIDIKISHDNLMDYRYSSLFAPGVANTRKQAQMKKLSNAPEKGYRKVSGGASAACIQYPVFWIQNKIVYSIRRNCAACTVRRSLLQLLSFSSLLAPSL